MAGDGSRTKDRRGRAIGIRQCMPCPQHPLVPSTRECDRCSTPFCADCLVPLQGQTLCGRCKLACLRDLDRRGFVQDRLANDALMYSLVGSVICQVICLPIALVKGVQALRQRRGDAVWPERWKAITAVAICSVWLLVLLIVLVSALGAELAAKP